MALMLDIMDSSGALVPDVYARLKRTQAALRLTVDIFEAGQEIRPARLLLAGKSALPAYIAKESEVQAFANGQIELTYTLGDKVIGGEIVSLPDDVYLRAALDHAVAGDNDATLAALYRAVKARMATDPMLTAKISNVRDV